MPTLPVIAFLRLPCAVEGDVVIHQSIALIDCPTTGSRPRLLVVHIEQQYLDVVFEGANEVIRDIIDHQIESFILRTSHDFRSSVPMEHGPHTGPLKAHFFPHKYLRKIS